MTIFQLKIMAVITMTIDHIQAFFPFLPIQLRWIGRLPIPIFMFVTIQGFLHTKNRKEYMKRLYFASIFTQIIFALVGWSNSFIRVLFLLTVILWILEEESLKKKLKFATLFLLYQIMMLTICTTILEVFFLRNPVIDFLSFILLDFELGYFCLRISIPVLALIIPREDVLILLFGVLMYLTNSKKNLLMLTGPLFGMFHFVLTTTDFVVRVISKLGRMGFTSLAAFLSFLRPFVGLGHFDIGGDPWTENIQWMMVFSLLVILRYNGEKGRDMRTFFYIYYPTHILILTALSRVLL